MIILDFICGRGCVYLLASHIYDWCVEVPLSIPEGECPLVPLLHPKRIEDLSLVLALVVHRSPGMFSVPVLVFQQVSGWVPVCPICELHY